MTVSIKKNPLRKFAEKALGYPKWIAFKLITWMFRFKVKLVGTTKLSITKTDLKSVTFEIKNRVGVQNHIGQIHAAAMALLAESATGFVVGVNLPPGRLPLLKSMELKYVKRSVGAMKAVAWLTDKQIEQMQNQDKGDVLVDVIITDESGEEPVLARMNWAWVTK